MFGLVLARGSAVKCSLEHLNPATVVCGLDNTNYSLLRMRDEVLYYRGTIF